ncbi:MAG: hypothetical protein IPL87_01480 [Candidatus Moraniibacteriota bacterium]|nr:MAG: hypothetical protein IPL87_01480 [Candidatus Moranbacteria bacterium]
MLWFFAAVSGYLATAVSSITDKFLVSDRIEKPAAYVFLLCLFSLFTFVFAPFGLRIPPSEILALLFISGISFSWSLLFLYEAFRRGEVSNVLPLVGIFSAMISLLPSFRSEVFSFRENAPGLVAFLFLLFGAIALSRTEIRSRKQSLEVWFFSFLSGTFLAIFYALLKMSGLFGTNFISGLVWSRFGAFLGGLTLLLVPSFFRDIREFFLKWFTSLSSKKNHSLPENDTHKKAVPFSTGIIFVFGKTIAGVGALLIILATYQKGASVALVQALVGVQFAFVFLFALLLSKRFPHIYGERLSGIGWIVKVTGFIFISLGAWFATRGGVSLF